MALTLFNMVFIESFRARKKRERERASELVAASREQSQAELRKDSVKSRSGRSGGQMESRCVSAGCAEEEGLN